MLSVSFVESSKFQIQRNLFAYEAGKTRVWKLTVKMEVEFNT